MSAHNRKLQRESMRRFSARKVGGGYDGLGGSFLTAGGVPAPIYGGFSDCNIPGRDGQLVTAANPALAQAPMAGGGYAESPFIHASGWPETASDADLARAQTVGMAGGKRRRSMRAKKPSCGCMAGGSRRRRGRRSMRAKKQNGGAGGFSTLGGMAIGGNGPIAVPLYAPVPCDARAGTFQRGGALSPAPFMGGNGGYGADNGFTGSDCARATGSQMPVYAATSAGFTFSPQSAGVAEFMAVDPVAARGPMVGGKRRKTLRRRRSSRGKRSGERRGSRRAYSRKH